MTTPHVHASTAGRWMAGRSRIVPLAVCVLGLLLMAATASAQARVRVKEDHATIWRQGFFSVADVVRGGTVLEVVSRSGSWYNVKLPTPDRFGATGLVAVAQVEPVDAAEPPAPAEPPRTRPSPASSTSTRTTHRRGIRGFVQGAYGRFSANRSFDAVLDQSGGPWLGGGAQYLTTQGFFVEGAVDWFRRTGERVFVSGDEVFKLGIANTINIVPLSITGGYRFPRTGVAPYIGVGAGRYFFKETSEFASESENVSIRLTSYHVLAGAELRAHRNVGIGVEAQYTHVPGGLDAGVAEIFDEHDLGGFQVRVKLFFGR